jgi:excisionase family DNA binding protein
MSTSDVMTVAELAKMLRVNENTVYREIAAGHVPGVLRLGRTIRISRTAVLRWLGQDPVSCGEAQ